ncbi:HAD family phosphatase [Sphingomonas sp. LaA6.9]|uniref:HAD family hydrolase n=1 Tax=Sphingomonas sp. LaA6.9 TaxID=2919914 RepID=UPI001F5005CC|nr:HAD family phosphatase [Sphingomonas sp. LaA6.9]MCJ8158509.1 HAD family phosphatase [Sphingomonas sp. LaA6.9]
MAVEAVVFDVGNVLYRWEPRSLYERLIPDGQALDAFMDNVVTMDWHLQHDAGRPFAETSAELIAEHPQHAELIRAWGERFDETILGMVEGMQPIVEALDANRVPLFAITNFSGEFWKPFRLAEAHIFDRFREIVVSGDEKMLKPDPAIYDLAIARFGIAPQSAIFIDDREDNVEAARNAGMTGHHFSGAAALKTELERLGLL